MEEKIGHTVFKDVSLKQLAEQWEKDAEWDKMQLSFEDIVPCDCWN